MACRSCGGSQRQIARNPRIKLSGKKATIRYIGSDPPFSVSGASGKRYKIRGPGSYVDVYVEDVPSLIAFPYFVKA